MIGYQHADPAIFKVADQITDIANRDRIDAGEGLVEQDEMRLGCERPGNLDSGGVRRPKAPSPACTPQMSDRKLGQAAN